MKYKKRFKLAGDVKTRQDLIAIVSDHFEASKLVVDENAIVCNFLYAVHHKEKQLKLLPRMLSEQ